MNQFDALTQSRENHRMVADHIAAAEGMDANLRRLPFPGQALAAVPQGFRREFPFLQDDLKQTRGRAARGVLLETVVHLDDLGVVVGSQDRGSAPGKGEEQIDPDGEITRPHARNTGGDRQQPLALGGFMSGGADHDRLP